MKFTQPIAIVGIGGIFPGAPDPDTFWKNIKEGVSSSREVPKGRWALLTKDAYSPSGVQPDKAYSSRACFIDLEELELDPLYQVTLLVGMKAFKNAVTKDLDRKRTGIIIGNIALPTKKSSALSWEILGRTFEEKVLRGKSISYFEEVEPLNRYVTALPAGILAKALGLGGGTYTLDAACASSLYAIKLACGELLSGRADAMLSGGVSMADSLYTQMGFSQLQALSSSGICSPFDAKADGLVVGEGAGFFILKRLDDALAAGDHIYALIKGIGLSNDRDGNILAPSVEGQLRAMRAVYKQTGWDPQDVDIIECHGTGTPVGDAVEFESMKGLWGDKGWKKGQCIIGSVKSNVGHLLTGAGAAGLMKILFALKEKTLPPTANFATPAPELGLSASPFQILKEAKPWEKRNKDTPRRAAVSAFGFGGINAHVLLEEWVPPKKSSKKATLPKKSNSPIAIVGMDAHFGPWETLKAFQERAVEGKNGVKPKPKKNWFGVEDSVWFKEKFRNEIPFKGYGIEELSIPFGQFRIPPKELEEMLTQQLLMLKVAAGALADAGRKESDHLNSGCFIGIGFDLSSTNFFVRWSILNKVKDWAKELSLDLSESELEKWMRSLRDASSPALNANRVMGSLGNIVASRIAREYRFGGPSFAVSSEESSGLSALQAAVRNLQQKEIDLALVGAVDLAGDIRALINTDHAKDIPFGEGAGAVVLKRFEDAQKDRDKIYAVIKEIGAGKTEELVPDARADIGHAGAASAMASLIKTSLCLYHGILAEGPRRAGVSSSGVDGNCAHVMLEAYQETSAAKKKDEGHQSPSSKKPSRAITIPVGGKPFQMPFPEQKKSEPPALVRQFESTQAAKTQAHQTFLRLSQNITETISKNLAFQMQILKAMGVSPIETKTGPQEVPRSLDREQCMEFAVGKIGKVLGPKYVEIDQHPTRVRLPDEPMMFVDRITEIEGEALSLTSGRVVTEHDVLHNGWYLDGGRIPTCNAIEAGQADLFLSGYLGIDFKTKGRAVYRLLDATVTFHDHLPKPGDTIRYDIRILNFFTQGDTYLFRFEFDGAVNGNPILSMRNGCAGFFSPAELAAGKGIVQKEIDKKPMPKTLPEDWKELVPMCVESYSEEQLDALRAGDLAGCFGPDFEGLKINKPFTLPGGKMKVIHRVQHLDPKGGRYGSGLIRAEADVHPKDWFLTCHFSDDNVMPGTLMYECCLHSLRIFLLRMGWVTEESSAVWEPVPGVSSQLKCRGQVLASTKKAAYEITIKELGYRPEPYAVADGIMYADGKPIVEVTKMCVQLTGATREQILALWKNKEKKSDIVKKPAIYDHKSILAFAEGKPSEGFGELYKPFDEGRFIARFPRPPYNFIHRATEARSEPWKMVPGGMIETQYDLPSNEWYFSSNRTNYMPFAVLLEIALQTCGWYSAYMGSALASESDLHYRNLGGVAVMYEPVFPDAGVITARAKSTKVSSSGGMVIQHYDFEILREAKTVYKGNTYFGFFSKQALAQQEGIRDAKIYKPRGEEMAKAKAVPYPTDPPFPDKKLRMIDQIDLYVPDGGPNGLGFIRGSMKVDPGAWFFKAHFYQDPVVPGSLGLESMLQVLKFAAFERWGKEQTMLTVASGIRHEWIYRGQVLPQNSSVSVDAWITSIDEKNRVMFADGFLSVDGLIIYQMKDFSLRMGDGKK